MTAQTGCSSSTWLIWDCKTEQTEKTEKLGAVSTSQLHQTLPDRQTDTEWQRDTQTHRQTHTFTANATIY